MDLFWDITYHIISDFIQGVSFVIGVFENGPRAWIIFLLILDVEHVEKVWTLGFISL